MLWHPGGVPPSRTDPPLHPTRLPPHGSLASKDQFGVEALSGSSCKVFFKVCVSAVRKSLSNVSLCEPTAADETLRSQNPPRVPPPPPPPPDPPVQLVRASEHVRQCSQEVLCSGSSLRAYRLGWDSPPPSLRRDTIPSLTSHPKASPMHTTLDGSAGTGCV